MQDPIEGRTRYLVHFSDGGSRHARARRAELDVGAEMRGRRARSIALSALRNHHTSVRSGTSGPS